MKGKSFVWTKEAHSAFQVIKKLTMAPILLLPYFSKVFELYTDALRLQLAGFSVKEFVLFTDHDSLRYIRTQDKVSHKHGRWLAFLKKFTVVVKHKTGVSNRATDALIGRGFTIWTETIFFLHDGFLSKENQLCIPDSCLCLQIIKELHGEGHVGHDRTLQLVQASYFWPTMRKEVVRTNNHYFTSPSYKNQTRNKREDKMEKEEY
ncbi:putative nucleotidyltransferase, ribonuclease H [Tanacetum coccineum]